MRAAAPAGVSSTSHRTLEGRVSRSIDAEHAVVPVVTGRHAVAGLLQRRRVRPPLLQVEIGECAHRRRRRAGASGPTPASSLRTDTAVAAASPTEAAVPVPALLPPQRGEISSQIRHRRRLQKPIRAATNPTDKHARADSASRPATASTPASAAGGLLGEPGP
jgi:hypothetical protein